MKLTQSERVLAKARSYDGVCQGCGKPLVRRDGERPSHFARRQSCDMTCRALAAKGKSYKRSQPEYVVVDAGHTTRCWLWQRSTSPGGYGQIRRDGRLYAAHRWYYEQAHGAVPGGLELDHLCRNRNCVNPDHLEPVTREVNQRRGANAKLTESHVRAIRASSLGYRRLAAMFGVHRSTIKVIKRRQGWKDVT